MWVYKEIQGKHVTVTICMDVDENAGMAVTSDVTELGLNDKA
jgi:hypothetical protein